MDGKPITLILPVLEIEMAINACNFEETQPSTFKRQQLFYHYRAMTTEFKAKAHDQLNLR
jgi:hypothetical protein